MSQKVAIDKNVCMRARVEWHAVSGTRDGGKGAQKIRPGLRHSRPRDSTQDLALHQILTSHQPEQMPRPQNHVTGGAPQQRLARTCVGSAASDFVRRSSPRASGPIPLLPGHQRPAQMRTRPVFHTPDPGRSGKAWGRGSTPPPHWFSARTTSLGLNFT